MNTKLVDKACRVCFIFAFALGIILVAHQSARAQDAVPKPYIQVILPAHKINARQWPVGNQVTMTIDTNGDGVTDYTDIAVVVPANGDGPNDDFAPFAWPSFGVQPGFVITMHGNDAQGQDVQKTLIVSDPKITMIDAASDTVSGTATPGSQVNVWAQGATRWVTADPSTSSSPGAWMVNFSATGNLPDEQGLIYLQPRRVVVVYQLDTDGDYTQVSSEVPNSNIDVNADADWLEGYDWPANSTVSITIQDTNVPDGSHNYNTSADVGKSNWNSSKNYFSVDLKGTYDIQPGSLVSVSDGYLIKTITVTDLVVKTIDFPHSTVSGTTNSNENLWGTVYNTNNNNVVMDIPNVGGSWTADFSSQYTFKPGDWGRVFQNDDDGDATIVDWHTPNPTGIFTVVPDHLNDDISNMVLGSDWPAGETITLRLANPTNSVGWDYTDTLIAPDYQAGFAYHQFEFDIPRSEFVIEAGTHVEMSDGTTTKDYTVSTLRPLSADFDNATISGVADPGKYIHAHLLPVFVSPNHIPADRWVLVGSDGNWAIDFAHLSNAQDSGVVTHISRGQQSIILSQGDYGPSDPQSEDTTYWWWPDYAHMEVNPINHWMKARGWPEGTSIHMTASRDGNTICQGDASMNPDSSAPNNILANFDLWNPQCDLQPADMITMNGGGTSIVYSVAPLQATRFDVDADTVTGIALPGSEVDVWTGSAYQSVLAVAGNWTVDFSSTMFGSSADLVPGSYVGAMELDVSGSSTWTYWLVPFDSDGDGIPDNLDACPNQNPHGLDADHDGCTDTAAGLRKLVADAPASAIASNNKTSLLAKMDNAISSLNKKNKQSAAGQLQAFINEVQAQRGKKISTQTADLLIAYARNVITGMP